MWWIASCANVRRKSLPWIMRSSWHATNCRNRWTRLSGRYRANRFYMPMWSIIRWIKRQRGSSKPSVVPRINRWSSMKKMYQKKMYRKKNSRRRIPTCPNPKGWKTRFETMPLRFWPMTRKWPKRSWRRYNRRTPRPTPRKRNRWIVPGMQSCERHKRRWWWRTPPSNRFWTSMHPMSRLNQMTSPRYCIRPTRTCRRWPSRTSTRRISITCLSKTCCRVLICWRTRNLPSSSQGLRSPIRLP